MKSLPAIALCGLLAGLTSIQAAEDPVARSSPDGSMSVKNVGDSAAAGAHFQIVSCNGDVLLASDKHPDLKSGSFADRIFWSKDSRYVAFSVRTSGPYIRDTFVYSTQSKHLLLIPTAEDDSQTSPVCWHDARTLIVQTRAPFGGKATEDTAMASYRYRRTFRFSESPLRLQKLYTSPRSHPKP